MRLTENQLRRVIRRRITQSLNESNAAYRATRMAMGGGLALDVILDPYDPMNQDWDDDGDGMTRPDLQEVHNNVMLADHIAGRKHRGDMDEVRKVGPRWQSKIEKALEMIQQNPRKYTRTEEGEHAVTIFLQDVLSIIEGL